MVQDGSVGKVSALFPPNYVNIVEASSLGLPGKTILQTDRNNFAPRLGLAYRPWGVNTVIRGGFGIYFDVVPRELTMADVPFRAERAAVQQSRPTIPWWFCRRVFPAAGSRAHFRLAAGRRKPEPADPVQHAVQPHDRACALGHGIPRSRTSAPTPARATIPTTTTRPCRTAACLSRSRGPFRSYPAINYFTNGAGHQFHSLTAEVERRMARGLQFQSSWVWARDIGDLERGQALENPFDRARERSVAPDIPTHRFTTNWIYQLPLGKGRHSSATSGPGAERRGRRVGHQRHLQLLLRPVPDAAVDRAGPDRHGVHDQSATRPVVTIRPDHLRDANLPGDERTLSIAGSTRAPSAPRRSVGSEMRPRV